MNGSQVTRARKRLGMTVQEFADRCRVSRRTVWLWGRDGVTGPAEALIEILLQQHQSLRAVRPKQSAPGKIASLAENVRAISSKPKRRKSTRVGSRKLAEVATADYLRRGGRVTKLPGKR